MATELTNLLPPERIRDGKREYFIHLGSTAVFAIAVVVIGSGALLVPSYLYLSQAVAVEQARMSDLDARLASTQEKGTTARLNALADTTSYLARLATTTSATAALGGVLAVPRTGVRLTGFTYSPPVQGNDGKMTLVGIASTRETLRAYDQALAALPFVSKVDLPISAYAKESMIPFVITLTGSLRP